MFPVKCHGIVRAVYTPDVVCLVSGRNGVDPFAGEATRSTRYIFAATEHERLAKRVEE